MSLTSKRRRLKGRNASVLAWISPSSSVSSSSSSDDEASLELALTQGREVVMEWRFATICSSWHVRSHVLRWSSWSGVWGNIWSQSLNPKLRWWRETAQGAKGHFLFWWFLSVLLAEMLLRLYLFIFAIWHVLFYWGFSTNLRATKSSR